MERRRRTVLKKSGSPDISVEVYGTDGEGFSTKVDGKESGVIWPNYSPEQLKSGNTPPRTLDDAWRTLLSQYPDYSPGVVEDAVPA